METIEDKTDSSENEDSMLKEFEKDILVVAGISAAIYGSLIFGYEIYTKYFQ